MDYQQLYTEIQTLPNLVIKIGKKEPAAIATLSRLHEQVYGESVCVTCTNKHIQAYSKLTSLTLENLKAMSEKKYELKKGESLTLNNEFGGKFLINHNLTDEESAEHLSNVPEDIKKFAKYPEDWNKKAEPETKSKKSKSE
jgi:hypothetical protein